MEKDINQTLQMYQQMEDSGIQSERILIEDSQQQQLPIRTNLNSTLNTQRTHYKKLDDHLFNLSSNTKEKNLQFLNTSYYANQRQEQKPVGYYQKQKQQEYEFELKIQKIEKMYTEFESYFNEFKRENIISQLNRIKVEEQQQKNQQDTQSYEQIITNTLVKNSQIHDKIISKFKKMKLLAKELDKVYHSMDHINYNRIQHNWKSFLSDVKSSKCQCSHNKFMNQFGQKRSKSQTQVNSSYQQSNTNSTGHGGIHKRSESKGSTINFTKLNNETTSIQQPYHQPLQFSIKMANQGKDMQISANGYVPINISIPQLILNPQDTFLLQPINDFLQSSQGNLDSIMMKELNTQSRDEKIFQQFQKSFIKNPFDQESQPDEEEEENNEIVKLKESWKKKDKHNIIHKKIIKESQQEHNKNKKQVNVIENEVMRSLFDMEMCIACKYQRILYRDFILKLEQMDQHKMAKLDTDLNQIIHSLVDQFLSSELEFNDHKEIQRILIKLLKIAQQYLIQMGIVMPLHSIFGEKILKLFSFLFSVSFEMFNDSFNQNKADFQKLSQQLYEYNYQNKDYELLKMELVTLKEELMEKNEQITQYEQDKRVAIKDIEKDIDSLNTTFQYQYRSQEKVREAIKKEVRELLKGISGENKNQNSHMESMLELIIKKFEIVKHNFQANSVGTQTIIVGAQRINHKDGEDAQSSQVSKISKRGFYFKIIDIYRPFLAFELQKRRFYEVFEAQNICEEFIYFLTSIKMKPADSVQITLSKLPNTYHQELQKKGSIKLQRRMSKLNVENEVISYLVDRKTNPAVKEIVKYGAKDELLNYLSEFLIFKSGNNKDNIIIEVNHFLVSLENIAIGKQSLSAKIILLLLDHGTDFVQIDQVHDENIFKTQEIKQSQRGLLNGDLINLNEVINEKISQLLFQTYYLLEKVFKKEKYIKILLGQSYKEEIFSLHRSDLKNKKISLRVIFTVFERMLGKISLQMKEDLIDALMNHYAQNDDYREANATQKFFSIIAVQIMMKNLTDDLHYDWIVSHLYGLITTQTQISVQDLINDEYTNENLFEMVQNQCDKNKSKDNETIFSQSNHDSPIKSQEDGKKPSTSGSLTIPTKQRNRSNSTRKQVRSKYNLSQLVAKKSIMIEENKEQKEQKDKDTAQSSPNQKLDSKFKLQQQQEQSNEVGEIKFNEEPRNHITDEAIKSRVEQKKEFLCANINIEKFIKLLNYSKIYIPCIKEALNGYQNYYIQENATGGSVRIEKPLNQIKNELGLLDFISLFILLICKYLEQKKQICFEKYRMMDPMGKGIKDTEFSQYLINLDFFRIFKQRQFSHIIDELKFTKLEQMRAQDKLEDFQRQLDDKKTDSFINFKYKEIQQVIENKWWLIKELIDIKEEFLAVQKDIEKKKAQYLQQLKAGSLFSKDNTEKHQN